jgi:hypothetical protein
MPRTPFQFFSLSVLQSFGLSGFTTLGGKQTLKRDWDT